MRLVIAGALAGLLLAAPAAAATGGAEARGNDGGAHFADPAVVKKPRARAKLTLLTAGPTLPATVRFRIDWRRPVRAVRLEVLPAAGGPPLVTRQLGTRRSRRLQRVSLTAAGLVPGAYRVRIVARGLRRARGVPPSVPVTVPEYAFPVQGPFTYGGKDARFGAKRDGHTHQGQDLIAAAGTPVVTPRGGTVKAVDHQAGGAGHYIVVDSDRDYVFMHLEAGSITLREGDAIATGGRVGTVGSTGRSSGPHLHFEIWTGKGWYTGGEPVDPLPFLQSWAPST